MASLAVILRLINCSVSLANNHALTDGKAVVDLDGLSYFLVNPCVLLGLHGTTCLLLDHSGKKSKISM